MAQRVDVTGLLDLLSPEAHADLLVHWSQQVLQTSGADPIEIYGDEAVVETEFSCFVIQELIARFELASRGSQHAPA